MSVLAESQGGKRLTAHPGPQGHPLKSFSVPAPPPISAPGTPQAKHVGKFTLHESIPPVRSPLGIFFKKLHHIFEKDVLFGLFRKL